MPCSECSESVNNLLTANECCRERHVALPNAVRCGCVHSVPSVHCAPYINRTVHTHLSKHYPSIIHILTRHSVHLSTRAAAHYTAVRPYSRHPHILGTLYLCLHAPRLTVQLSTRTIRTYSLGTLYNRPHILTRHTLPSAHADIMARCLNTRANTGSQTVTNRMARLFVMTSLVRSADTCRGTIRSKCAHIRSCGILTSRQKRAAHS